MRTSCSSRSVRGLALPAIDIRLSQQLSRLGPSSLCAVHQVWLRSIRGEAWQSTSHTNSPASTDLTDTFLLLVPRCCWRPVSLLLSLSPAGLPHSAAVSPDHLSTDPLLVSWAWNWLLWGLDTATHSMASWARASPGSWSAMGRRKGLNWSEQWAVVMTHGAQ